MKKTLLNLKHTAFLLIIVLSFGLSSCGDSTSPLDINLFSLEDDKQLGGELAAEINSDTQEYPPYNDAEAQLYLQDIMNEILKSSEVRYEEEFAYQVKIINKGDIVNAFALPGGYVYVYTGLLKFLDNEAALASVVAHEIAHAERRHATKRMTKYYGVQDLLGIVLGQDPALLEEVAANLLTGLGFLYNSREDEYEADEFAFKYLLSTKWYPGAMTYFFDKVKSNEEAGFLQELLSTHPLPQQRIDAVEELIKDYSIAQPTEANLFSQRYSEFKATLP